jgi:hypothetical protein
MGTYKSVYMRFVWFPITGAESCHSKIVEFLTEKCHKDISLEHETADKCTRGISQLGTALNWLKSFLSSRFISNKLKINGWLSDSRNLHILLKRILAEIIHIFLCEHRKQGFVPDPGSGYIASSQDQIPGSKLPKS